MHRSKREKEIGRTAQPQTLCPGKYPAAATISTKEEATKDKWRRTQQQRWMGGIARDDRTTINTGRDDKTLRNYILTRSPCKRCYTTTLWPKMKWYLRTNKHIYKYLNTYILGTKRDCAATKFRYYCFFFGILRWIRTSLRESQREKIRSLVLIVSKNHVQIRDSRANAS